jgi:hypothetical protein
VGTSSVICLWATSSTIGVTEYLGATGPETLNAAQPKGAKDAPNLHADAEQRKPAPARPAEERRDPTGFHENMRG